VGRTYLETAEGLLKSDPVLLQTAPTFFGLSIDGSLELAQMAIARLFDRTRGTMTVPTLLDRADMEAGSFQHALAPEVRATITESKKVVFELEPVLGSIRERRKGWLAHLDPQTIADPGSLEARAKLTIPDLQRAFKETENILLKLSSLYDGTIGELKYIGGDDYEVALDWIRRAKCAFIAKYEQEFKETWNGPRPKDCSRKDWELL
jgi:hypothetical protein